MIVHMQKEEKILNKSLTDMTNEELWELFPIELEEHNEAWKTWYAVEKRIIEEAVGKIDIKINHIGSTAIPGIKAKPIVDILAEIPLESSMETIRNILISSGYICMSESNGRMSFNKGYTTEGYADKVFHLHLRYYGDNAELAFRDAMCADPDAAREYERLKEKLAKKYRNNRDAYTEAKSEFILNYSGLN